MKDYYALEDMTLNEDEDDEDEYETVFDRRNTDDLNFKFLKKQDQVKCSYLLIISIASIILLLTTCILYLSLRNTDLHLHKVPHLFSKSNEWFIEFPRYPSESCVRLVDVDEDGRDDVIFGFSDTALLDQNDANTYEKLEKICLKNTNHTSCIGFLVAVSGHSGQVLWKLPIQSVPFEINCGHADFNGDGKMDCLVAGRMSTCHAFDPRTGKEIWRIDPKPLQFMWNIYNPLVVVDLTDDGVADVLIAHGGDPVRDASDHHRFAGRLLLVDGASGHMIGTRYLNMSHERETYDSPVMHTTRDGSQYILYGDGGETVDGHFKAISLPDLYRYVLNLDANAKVPNIRGSYSHYKHLEHDQNGVISIYARFSTDICDNIVGKGVMIPPTLVDMNEDGTDDILMIAFDSRITLYDGETMKQMWTNHDYTRYESYSQMAPGYFNNDTHLDFMLHLNRGKWPKYNYSLVSRTSARISHLTYDSRTVILDGLTGMPLWTLNSTGIQMTSDLVLRTDQSYRDAFLFRLSGVDVDDIEIDAKSPPSRKKRTAPRKGVPQGYLGDSLHPIEGETDDKPTTDDTSTAVNEATDTSASDTTTENDDDDDEEDKSFSSDIKVKGQSGDSCVVLNAAERNTGMIGDTDGDGVLDMIVIASSDTDIKLSVNSTLNLSQTTVRKVNLVDIVHNQPKYLDTNKFNLWRSQKLIDDGKLNEKPLNECDFASLANQKWRGYLGTYGDARYRN